MTRNSNDYGNISYYDAPNGDLKVARCVRMSCAPGSLTINTVDGTGTTGSEEDDAGLSAGGAFELRGGFWPGAAAPADGDYTLYLPEISRP